MQWGVIDGLDWITGKGWIGGRGMVWYYSRYCLGIDSKPRSSLLVESLS